ncbi:MAG: hypothetical protein AB8H79_17805 [Myxococcota bacterium]
MIWFTLALWSFAGNQPIALDAGPLNQHTLDGFSALTEFTSADPRVSWHKAPRRSAETLFPDPLAGDYVTENGVLSANLPPGKYTLSFMLSDRQWHYKPPAGLKIGVEVNGAELVAETVPTGDAFFTSDWYAANQRPVFRPDETVWHRQTSRAHHWYTVEFEAKAGPTLLRPFGGNLHALYIAESRELARTEVELAVIDGERKRWFTKYMDPARVRVELPWATPGPLELRPGRWSDAPLGYALNDEDAVQLTVAKGERTTAVVAIEGGDEPATWSISGLEGVGVEVDEVTWLDQRGTEYLSPRAAFLTPSQGAISGKQGLSPLLALTFTTPAHTPSGTHTGQLSITRGADTATLPLEVRVRKLHLEQPSLSHGTFADMRSPVGVVYGEGSERDWHVLEADMVELRSRGVTELALRMTSKTGESPRFGRWGAPQDPSLFLEAVERWQSLGGKTVFWVDAYFQIERPLFLRGTDEVLGTDPEPMLQSLVKAATTHPNTCLYIYDERAPNVSPEVLEKTRRFVAELQARSEAELCLAAARPHPVEWSLSDVIQRPMTTFHRLSGSPSMQALKQANRPATLYLVPEDREHAGLVPWALGADAVVHWHYNEAKGDPFNEVARSGPWTRSYLHTDGRTILPSSTLEALGEGIVDSRYLATTEALIEELDADRRGRVQHLVEGGKTLLAVARSNHRNRTKYAHARGYVADAALDRLRQELGEISELLARYSRQQRKHRRRARARPNTP